MKIKGLLCIALFCLVFSPHLFSGEQVPLGHRITLSSEILNETRPILIHTPPGYQNSFARFPVLYVMDGNSSFLYASGVTHFLSDCNLSPKMIVVAIPNTDRNRDLTPTHISKDWDQKPTERFKTTGGADKMLRFMKEELFPYVEKEYKTQPFRILAGHSFGGLFVMHAFLSHTELFQGYIATSPSLWFDGNLLVKKAETFLKEYPFKGQFLYFSVGGLESDRQVGPNQRFFNLLYENKPKDLRWRFEFMEGETHGSLGLESLSQGFRFIFDQWKAPFNLMDQELPLLTKHFKALSDYYGFKVSIPEDLLNSYGYRLLRNGEKEKALAAFKFNVKNYPNSPNTYDSLGEAFEALGDLKSAAKNYKIACEKGESVSDGFLHIYKTHLEKARSKLKSKAQ